jgi:hypothetical protein
MWTLIWMPNVAKNYRALRTSYGFRGRYWKEGEIAYDVTEAENINQHFVAVGEGEAVPPAPERDDKNTLSGNLPKVAHDGKVPETLHEAAHPDWRKKKPSKSKK